MLNSLFNKPSFKSLSWNNFRHSILDSVGRLKFILCQMTNNLSEGVLFNLGQQGRAHAAEMEGCLKKDFEVSDH